MVRTTLMPLIVLASVLLHGCGTPGLAFINFSQPTENQEILRPEAVPVSIKGTGAYSGLQFLVDGADVTNTLHSVGPAQSDGSLTLGVGTRILTASAMVDCPSCSTPTVRSAINRTIYVRECSRADNPGTITLDAQIIKVGQTQGRKVIGVQTRPNKNLVKVVVNDAPGLSKDQIRVTIDLGEDVIRPKAIEAWATCNGSASTAVTARAVQPGGFGVGVICGSPASPCTFPQTAVLDRATARAVIFKVTDGGGVFHNEEVFDTTFWDAFQGRDLSVIWVTE